MKEDNRILTRSSSEGFTLVEVIVSMTLLVIVAGILLTGVMASGVISSRSTDLTNEGYRIADLLQNKTQGNNEQVVLSVNGEEIVVSGLLVSEDNYSGVRFTMFVPNLIASSPPAGDINPLLIQAKVGGNSSFVILSYPSLTDYFFEQSAEDDEILIPKGVIFYERWHNKNKKAYYISGREGELENDDRKQPIEWEDIKEYITDDDDDDGPHAVKINMDIDPMGSEYTEPNNNHNNPKKWTQPGDIKKIEDNGVITLYVFFPKKWESWKEKEDEWKVKNWKNEIENGDNWILLPTIDLS